MPELMGDIRAEPKPGTALGTMVKEHRHLDEFMAMVKAKMELDEKYLSQLKDLRNSWNPEWNESGAWGLISPLLTHINNEIEEREQATTELNSGFAALPDTHHPNALHKDGFDPLETLENAELRYHQYEKCYKIISTLDSVAEFKRWRDKVFSAGFRFYDVNSDLRVLPRPECEYRRAVVAQQSAARCAVKWQADTLPGVLERHQQRAEDIKSFLSTLLICYNALYSGFSNSCSTALKSTRAFSPSGFIAPRHDETGEEGSHALLQAVDYRNYMMNGSICQPIFGLGVKKTVSLINELLNYGQVSILYSLNYESIVSSGFELEKEVTRWERSALLTTLDETSISKCIECALLADKPLLPLPEEVVTQYRNGISRAVLSSVMVTHVPLARWEVVALVVRLVDKFANDRTYPRTIVTWAYIWNRMALLLSNNKAAAQIIESIWRKWDIANDCPLPEGVQRVWSEEGKKSEVVRKKTGDPYYPSISNSSA